jgi:hypothetical protein
LGEGCGGEYILNIYHVADLCCAPHHLEGVMDSVIYFALVSS